MIYTNTKLVSSSLFHFRAFVRKKDTLLGFIVDPTEEAALLLCVTKAATESLTLVEFNTACVATLGEPSIQNTTQQSSAAVPSLVCIHTTAVSNTVQKAGSSCECTEDLLKIGMKVDKKTRFTTMAMSAANLGPLEMRIALAKASLSPTVVNVDGAGVAAGGAAAAVESTMWPFEREAQRRSSFLKNMIPQAWHVPFQHTPGGPIALYSVVAPGTEFVLCFLCSPSLLAPSNIQTLIYSHTRTHLTMSLVHCYASWILRQCRGLLAAASITHRLSIFRRQSTSLHAIA